MLLPAKEVAKEIKEKEQEKVAQDAEKELAIEKSDNAGTTTPRTMIQMPG